MSNLPPGYSGYDGTAAYAFRCRLCRLVWVEEISSHFNAWDRDPLCPRETGHGLWKAYHQVVLTVLTAICFSGMQRTKWLGRLYDYLTWPVELPYYSKASRAAREAYEFKVLYGGRAAADHEAEEALDRFLTEDR